MVRDDHVEVVDQEFRRGDLYRIRALTAAHANRQRAAPNQIDKVVLIASELVVNAVSHGGGRGRLRLWRDGDNLYCEVSDGGPGIPDAGNAGLNQPAPGRQGGRGLWVVRSVAEAVEIQSGPDGTTITACLPLQD